MAEIVFGTGVTLSVPGEPEAVVRTLTMDTSGWAPHSSTDGGVVMINSAQIAYVQGDEMATVEHTGLMS